MDDLSWLIEGVATYVSGQMDEDHAGQDIEAIQKGRVPKTLSTLWSGRYRYALSGSLVRYIDQHYGRNKLIEILEMTKQDDVLKHLSTTEDQLLKDWQADVIASASASDRGGR